MSARSRRDERARMLAGKQDTTKKSPARPEDYLSETISSYDESSAFYERLFSGRVQSMQALFSEFSSRVRARTTPGEPPRLLDAGCGTGDIAQHFFQNGFSVVGIDLSLGMLHLAEEKIAEISSFQNVSEQIANHARGVTFLEGDVRKLPFALRAFDGVLCLAVLLHLKPEDQDKALSEFARVLTPGGMLLCSVKAGRGAARRHDAGGWRLAFLQSPKAFQSRVEKAGFRVLKTELNDEWIEVLAEKK